MNIFQDILINVSGGEAQGQVVTISAHAGEQQGHILNSLDLYSTRNCHLGQIAPLPRISALIH